MTVWKNSLCKLGLALLCLLFLWGLSTLVEAEPVEAVTHQSLQTPLSAALLPMGEIGTGDHEPARREPGGEALCPAMDTAPDTPVTDRNGTPVRNETYIKAVWQAFPPEGTLG